MHKSKTGPAHSHTRFRVTGRDMHVTLKRKNGIFPRSCAYPRFMDTLLQLSGGVLSHGWFPLEDLQDAGGMTWEDVDEAAKVWAERNRIEISDGRVRMLD